MVPAGTADQLINHGQPEDRFLGGFRPGQLAGDPAVLHHVDAIREAEDLRQLGADEHDPQPLVGEIINQAVDFGLGADVNAARRLVEDQDFRLRSQPARQDDLLLVAAGKLADLLFERRCAHAQRLDEAGRDPPLQAPAHEVKAADLGQDRQRRVFQHAADQHQSLALAILGRKADPLGNRVIGPADRHVPAVEGDLAACLRQLAEDDLGQLGPPRADEARKPDNLARIDIKVRVLVPVAVQAGHPQDLVIRARGVTLKDVGKLAAHHQPHDFGVVQLSRRSDRDELAVAQDGDAVAEPQDLLDAVRHVNDRHPLVAQPPDEREQAIYFFVGQRGGRFVEGQHPHARFQRAHDFDKLALGGGKLVALEVRRQDVLKTVFGQAALYLLVELSPVKQAETLRQLAGPDVFGDVNARDDLRLLVNDPDAGLVRSARVGERQPLPIHRQRAGIRLVIAVDDFEQRGFAGAVLAHKREDFAGSDVERDIVEGLNVGERLADIADFQRSGRRGRRFSRGRRSVRYRRGHSGYPLRDQRNGLKGKHRCPPPASRPLVGGGMPFRWRGWVAVARRQTPLWNGFPLSRAAGEGDRG